MIESRTFKMSEIETQAGLIGKYIMIYYDQKHLPAKILGVLPNHDMEVEVMSGSDKGVRLKTYCLGELEIKVYNEDQLILLLLG